MNIYQTEFKFYVYAYLREDGTPYYIGKGCNKRVYRSTGRIIKPPKNRSYIVFLETNLSNVGALALERRYIEWYGRKYNGTGILRNSTIGGDGGLGNPKPSKETREKLSKSKSGNKNPNFGKHHSDIHKEKLSKATKGRPLSNEHVEKISISVKEYYKTHNRIITENTRQKISKSTSGKNNHASVQIIYNNVLYETITECKKINNISYRTIMKTCIRV
jgi:NUMOD3 motif